jgi:hypothetical protein
VDVAGKIAVVMKQASLGEVRSLDVTLALSEVLASAAIACWW